MKLRPPSALLLLLFPLVALGGCASDQPRDTTYVWNLASDRPVHRHPSTSTSPVSYTRPRNGAQSPIQPRQKPVPGWYRPTPETAASPVATQAASAMNIAFAWPIEGRIISDYGSTTSGERNDGINIAAPSGTPIHAAASGTVSYAGNELKGYGNLVLIRHDDGYVTAYAHAQNIIVTRGDIVRQGQVVGYAGDTGDVTEPQLHFEIRHDTAPVNPHQFLATTKRTS